LDFQENICREDCLRLAKKYGDHTWYIYGETQTHEVARFYTSGYSGQIIRRDDTAGDPSAYYLVDRILYPDFQGDLIDSLLLERSQTLAFMRPRE
jgi:hypothetical protein